MSTAEIFEIKRFAVHDGDGIRTTVFFKGCPLRCVWCHNPEGLLAKKELAFIADKCVGCGKCTEVCQQKAHRISDGLHSFLKEKCALCGECEKVCLNGALKLYGKTMSVDELLPILLEDRDFYKESGGGVTLSGGECLLYSDFCRELLRQLKNEGIHTAVDTCGFVKREDIDKVLEYTDVFLYDIKAFDEDVHIKCTGQSNRIILENLMYIDSMNKDIEVRIPYVPLYNDGQIEKEAKFLSNLKNIKKVKVLPYHNFASSKYLSLCLNDSLPSYLPSEEEIENARRILRKYVEVVV